MGKMDNLIDKWWNKEHEGDMRYSGEFSYDEIKEFGIFLLRRYYHIFIIGLVASFILGVMI